MPMSYELKIEGKHMQGNAENNLFLQFRSPVLLFIQLSASNTACKYTYQSQSYHIHVKVDMRIECKYILVIRGFIS